VGRELLVCLVWDVWSSVGGLGNPRDARLRSATCLACNFSINTPTTYMYLVNDYDEAERQLRDYFHADHTMALHFPRPIVSIGPPGHIFTSELVC
jgi:hypothetical protein